MSCSFFCRLDYKIQVRHTLKLFFTKFHFKAMFLKVLKNWDFFLCIHSQMMDIEVKKVCIEYTCITFRVVVVLQKKICFFLPLEVISRFWVLHATSDMTANIITATKTLRCPKQAAAILVISMKKNRKVCICTMYINVKKDIVGFEYCQK